MKKRPIRPKLSGDEEKKLPRYFRFEKKIQSRNVSELFR